ncbi:tousled-like kinase [Marchantia polymorpha subsp. ruderalis]|uniref:Protein kinase domain-containing protein n=2 Tax=Marchantia polymorpha TaxID=3197 RepID=A0AAF6B138_MARPO|nr:hypothetical protein MARPO_0004s0128 [Marchantia polymorpha]PTQ48862.1 hypothetical protein MARPO_0004s0128 [Marchantia polymorpha]BBN05721.1 hypothetical protein Mp_3g15440 [Marchantia polymorpha subsp. ruderalis]BBN05722.1 hypothetical protein Mp_3g15440 [Marchantia polymorpha subsp. ruderalis]|eukprot:PTQ48860.1 hypothetical protein MARPO_0004s0128 [Marchantia polymorpha]
MANSKAQDNIVQLSMHDDVLLQLSSINSNSNPSDPALPIKIAKLEARMAGRASQLVVQSGRQESLSVSAYPTFGHQVLVSSSTDSEDEECGGFRLQANPRKRKTMKESGDNDGVQLEDSVEAQKGLEEEERERMQEEIDSLKISSSLCQEELAKARQETEETQQTCQQLEKDLKIFKEQEQIREQQRLKVVSDLLIAVARSERQEARVKVRQDVARLGGIGVMRAGTVISEVWEDGQAPKDIQARLRSLLEQKTAIEKHKKLLKRRQSEKLESSVGEAGMSEEEFLAMEEVYRTRLVSIRREEEVTVRDKDRYEHEKACHIREMKRIRDEDGSRFNHFPILNNRYALLNLLGKGGFSEVYKAYDLVDYKYVACKLHGLNAQWGEEKKRSYVRHAVREYNIHKGLIHSHIVRLWDIFEIDANTFCTVLEYCSGKDLDATLKATPSLPERDARSILVQIFSGLVYLNRRPQRIIHYDLKPGNVLFDEVGVAKMTDFGLSKIVEDEVGSQGMELTSQGAGTYWYLPPECFEVHKVPLISSKVDVWSAGVLFYQMLFGRRPFGHDQTQERILREDTIVKAHKVEFPPKPAVTSEAKDFIRRCLTYNQAERPDVLTAAQDPYLSYVKRKP